MLENCKICGHPPTSYSSKTQHKGCDITIWVVECDHFEVAKAFILYRQKELLFIFS